MGPTSMMQSGVSQAREFDDPPGLHEKTEFLLREWVTLYHSPAAGRDSSKAFCAIVSQVCVHLSSTLVIFLNLFLNTLKVDCKIVDNNLQIQLSSMCIVKVQDVRYHKLYV